MHDIKLENGQEVYENNKKRIENLIGESHVSKTVIEKRLDHKTP
jgi:hypothetical protein